MIRYSLACVGEHEFEAWFSSSKTYDTQRKKKLVECPVCGSTDVKKQIMAPMVRSSDRVVPAEVAAAKVAAEIRQHISSTHDYVGEKFADGTGTANIRLNGRNAFRWWWRRLAKQFLHHPCTAQNRRGGGAIRSVLEQGRLSQQATIRTPLRQRNTLHGRTRNTR